MIKNTSTKKEATLNTQTHQEWEDGGDDLSVADPDYAPMAKPSKAKFDQMYSTIESIFPDKNSRITDFQMHSPNQYIDRIEFRYWTSSNTLRAIFFTEYGTYSEFRSCENLKISDTRAIPTRTIDALLGNMTMEKYDLLEAQSREILAKYEGQIKQGRYYITEYTGSHSPPLMFTVRLLKDRTIVVDTSNCPIFNMKKDNDAAQNARVTIGRITRPRFTFSLTPKKAIDLHQLALKWQHEDIYGADSAEDPKGDKGYPSYDKGGPSSEKGDLGLQGEPIKIEPGWLTRTVKSLFRFYADR